MTVCCNGSGLMGPWLTLLMARLQGTLAIDHLAPPDGLPATAKSLASLLLTIAVTVVLHHTFLPSSLIHLVAPRARRIRHHATRIAHTTHNRASEHTIPPDRFQRLFDLLSRQAPKLALFCMTGRQPLRRLGRVHLCPPGKLALSFADASSALSLITLFPNSS